MAAFTFWGVGPAHGDPADIFTIGAPTIGSDAPKAADIQVGDARVSTQTGSFEYGYPIEVPPGRNGMQPQLSLSYSSTAPIYGGIANGWSLSIPSITEDTSAGRLWEQDSQLGVTRYVSSMAGGHPLILVNEAHATDATASYRAKNDSSFTRYELLKGAANGALWRARTTDGNIYTFGESNHVDGSLTAGSPCTTVSVSNAPLTHVEDAFGNAVDYYYEAGAYAECRIAAITWGENTNASIADFARVRFNYSIPAVPTGCPSGTIVGAQQSYRTGQLIVTGASELDSIVATAYAPGQSSTPAHTRTITLGYSPDSGVEQTASCASAHAAYRSLYSIHETAVGTDSPLVDLPLIKLTYGSAQFGTGQLAWTPVTQSNPWSFITTGPSGGANYNLGWGYRFNDPTGKWPTVEAMMLDVDGDGLLDRVVNAPYTASSDNRYHCRAQWFKNLGNFQFDSQSARYISIPTLKWATQNSACDPNNPSAPYAGSLQPNTHNAYDGESCALNYQRTTYNNTPSTEVISCQTQSCTCQTQNCTTGYCPDKTAPDYGKTCGMQSSPGPTYLAYRWFDADGDGLTDLIASPAMGSVYDLFQGTGVALGCRPGVQEPEILGPKASFPDCPATPFGITPTNKPYLRCGNMYPWMLYLNKGNGVFGVSSSDPTTPYPDKIVYQPTPLESDVGDSSLTALPVGARHGTFDLDGDGLVDGVDASDGLGSGAWGVYRNDTSGGLAQKAGAGGFSFGGLLQPISATSYTGPDNTGHATAVSSAGVFDLNGDGLADYWTTNQLQGPPTFNFNTGTGFGPVASSTIRPSNDGNESCYGGCNSITNLQRDSRTGFNYFGTSYPEEAQRTDTSRVMDVDDDGRSDVVQTIPGTTTLGTYFNEGGVINSQSVGAPGDAASVQHKIVATYQLAFGVEGTGPYTWELRSDLIDLDGDGIAEGVSFADHGSGIGAMTVAKIATPSQPPRLLVGVNNGRGASTAITYAAMSDSIVTRDTGVAMPRTGWVVKSMATTDTVPSGITSTTTYAYHNPHFSVEGDLLRDTLDGSIPSVPTVDGPSKIASFRGFDQVTTTRPSGAQDVETFDYSVDWSGRLVKHVVVPAEQPYPNFVSVASVDLTTWEWLPLFCTSFGPCAVKTYHATVQEHYTCGAGMSEAACTSATDNYTRTTTAYGIQGNSLWAPTRSVLSTNHASTPSSPQDGDRVTDTTYLTVADNDHYWLKTASDSRSSVSTGTLTPFATTIYTYDSSHRVPIQDDVYLVQTPQAGHPEQHAYTTRIYDLTTGNLLQRRKPAQQAANGPYRTYTYGDARKLYPTSVIDELGNELDYVYEFGTGTKLDTQGPNVASCTLTNTCPTGSVAKQSVRIRVDGLGRTIETYETLSNDGSSYAPVRTRIDSYDDASVPNSTTHQQAYANAKNGSYLYTKTTTLLDGHGRPSRKTDYVFGSAPTDAVTTYQYGSDGTLQSVSLPDPSANGTATVTYTYGYDSLGRPTSIRRPDTSVLSDRSGVNIAYDGLIATTTEVVKSGDGNAAITKATKDAFGRLVAVDEQLTNAPLLTWATTTYSYDPADRVTSVSAPENVNTAIQYDFAGRRTDIVRAGRTWHFTFDQNDNVATLTTPHTCAQGDPCDPRYITSYAYDALDRMTSKFIAHRELSADDLALFAADKETFVWDYGVPGHTGNYKGNLIYWRSFAPDSSTATQQRYVTYDSRGNDSLVTDNSSAAGIGLQRQYLTTYSASGELSYVQYHDYVGGSNPTSATVAFDGRGLPQSINLVRAGVTNSQTIAAQTRNVAGLVTKRRTDQPGAPMTFVESNWTYDPLGRVASQVVQAGPGSTRVAEQDLEYFGNDDPKILDEYLGANHKQFAYGYDGRHQLVSVNETTTSGAYFNAAYAFGPGGRFTTASEHSTSPGPGSEIVPHDVTYEYGGQDPEQVTALVSGTTPFYGYAYDAAGNQTSRCSGGYPGTCQGVSVEYLYDGQDRLRRATKKVSGVAQGSEEYWYTYNGQRVETVRRDRIGTILEAIEWLQDTEAHYDGSGILQYVYSYVSLGTPVARVNRTGNTTASLEYEFRGLGSSTLAAVDSSGAVNASFSYSPFGALLETTDAGAGNGVASHHRRFNDKYVDDATALAYYGARYYDRTSLTWTQPDPVYQYRPDAQWGSPRRADLYTFTLNNALRYSDPDGRFPALARKIVEDVATDAGEGVELGPIGEVLLAKAVVDVSVDIYDAATGGPTPTVPPLPGTGDLPHDEKVGPAGNETPDDAPPPDCGGDTFDFTKDNVGRMKNGEPPIGTDGHPVELHHDGQDENSPLVELTRTAHRLGANFSKNHTNTGQEKSKVDRNKFKKKKEEHWKERAKDAEQCKDDTDKCDDGDANDHSTNKDAAAPPT